MVKKQILDYQKVISVKEDWGALKCLCSKQLDKTDGITWLAAFDGN